MKKISACIFSVIIICATIQSTAQCKAKQVVKECRPSVAPFIYDSYTLSQIVYDSNKSDTTEVEFTAFAGQKYKLVFCTSGLDQEIKVNIYDKNLVFKNRHKLYDSENGIEGHWSFEPPKSGTYYIDYEIPMAVEKKNGCVVMLIGYAE